MAALSELTGMSETGERSASNFVNTVNILHFPCKMEFFSHKVQTRHNIWSHNVKSFSCNCGYMLDNQ